MPQPRRAAVIGSTGKGNYGHGHDVVFKDLPGVEFVAIADDDEKGRVEAGKRTGVRKLYADYREMLAKEKPDLVAIGPRWVDQRVAMITAAAKAGCHIYSEKPLAGSLEDADRIVNVCQSRGVHLAVAHQLRSMPTTQKAMADARAGRFGKLLRMRARGKEDQRGGGEDLIVLGTHMMDLMTLFAGPPRWVSSTVLVDGRPAKPEDRRDPSEPVGRVAGDNLTATFGFDDGVVGTFQSRRNASRPKRSPYGIVLEFEEASVSLREGEVFVYPSSIIVPDAADFSWNKVWIEDWHFFPDHKPRPMGDRLERGNRILVSDLIKSVEEKRKPLSSVLDARWALEMIQGVYASHFAGGARLPIPLEQRVHPLQASKS